MEARSGNIVCRIVNNTTCAAAHARETRTRPPTQGCACDEDEGEDDVSAHRPLESSLASALSNIADQDDDNEKVGEAPARP